VTSDALEISHIVNSPRRSPSALPDRALYVDIRIGSRLDAFCTAHGKLWLAHLSPDDQDRYFKNASLKGMTDHTITDLDDLRTELAHIRDQGFSTNNGEREKDIYAIAVPILTKHGNMISAFSVFGASVEILDQNRQSLLESTQIAAHLAKITICGAN